MPSKSTAATVRRSKRTGSSAAAAAAPPPARNPQADAICQLRAQLIHVVDCLNQRQAHLIGDTLIDDYVSRDWMEWQGGGLRLTITGRNIYSQALKEKAAAAGQPAD